MRKLINIRVPVDLLEKMKKLREQEGIPVTFQFVKGAQLYHKMVWELRQMYER